MQDITIGYTEGGRASSHTRATLKSADSACKKTHEFHIVPKTPRVPQIEIAISRNNPQSLKKQCHEECFSLELWGMK